MRVFVAGASGAIGGRLVPELQALGHRVVGGSRSPASAARAHPGLSWGAFDVDDPEGMASALKGHEVLVYLVHRMNGTGDLVERESRAARRVARAAAEAGLQRIVYLGAVQPKDKSEPSPHILARALTGQILRDGSVPVVELQGSMIISGESESWRIVRDLAVRLPVMVLPAWLSQPTRPIGVDDVVTAIAHAVEQPHTEHVVDDLPGPEELTVKQILVRTAAQVGRRPVMLSVPVLSPGLSARWIHAVTRADRAIADHLVEGMLCDVRGSWPGYWRRMPDHTLRTFDEATAIALQQCGEPTNRAGRWFEAFAGAVSRKA